MNTAIVFGIIGLVAIGGIIGGVIYSNSKKKLPGENEIIPCKEDKTRDIDVNEEDTFTNDYQAQKAEAFEKIAERHKEAQELLKESVNKVFGETEVHETKNDPIKKKIFDDLNNL